MCWKRLFKGRIDTWMIKPTAWQRIRQYGLLVFLLHLLAACGDNALTQRQDYIFGTMVEISIYGVPKAEADRAIDSILQDYRQLHQSLHAWQGESELIKLNRAIADGESFEASLTLVEILTLSQAFAAKTDNTFNPAIGHLITLWGFQNDQFLPRDIDASELNKILAANPRMSDLHIQGSKISSTNQAVKLDLGGVAKGYALDRAASYLKSANIHHALINIGGNVIALGAHGDRPWRVGIQHPRRAEALATLDLPDGWAIGTSGDYQRFYMKNGQRYCHLIHPHTGYPAQNTQSATVLVPPGAHAGMLSDMASKPFFITNPEQRTQMKLNTGIDHILLIDTSGKVWMTHEMRLRLKRDAQKSDGTF